MTQTQGTGQAEQQAHDNAEKQAQRWRVAAGVFGLLAVVVGAYAIWDQRENTQKITEAIEGKARVERQLNATSEQLKRQEAANQALAKINLEGFLDDYASLLQNVKKASDAYDRAQQLPASDRGGAVQGAERDLYVAAAAFIRFIQQWRVVAAQLDKLLDGNVTRMDDARRGNDVNSLQDALRILITTLPTMRQPLEIELQKLKSPT